MKHLISYILLPGTILLFAFTPKPDHVSEQSKLITGLWKVESLKMKRSLTYQNEGSTENNISLRFDDSGGAYVVDVNTKSTIHTGTWTIKKAEVLIASDPFVYREDLVLNLDFDIPGLSIVSGSDIIIETEKDNLNFHFNHKRVNYCVRLIRVE